MYALISSPLAWRYSSRLTKLVATNPDNFHQPGLLVWLKKHYGLCIAKKMIQRRCVVVIDAVNVLLILPKPVSLSLTRTTFSCSPLVN